MDGVIANFDESFIRITGCQPREYEAKHGTVAFWDAILYHRNFFLDISPYPFIDNVIEMCEHMGQKVVILSSPSKFNTSICIEQKRRWLDLQGYDHMPAIFEKEKYNFANKHHLLIDDWGSNIDKWKAHGGQAHKFESFDGFKQFYEDWKSK